MHQLNQEQAAWRNQSFDTETTPPGYDAGYECELPPHVRTELVAPRRPRILSLQRSDSLKPAVKWPLYLAVLVAVIIIGAVALLWRQQGAERAKTNQAIAQPLTPQPTPAPAATPVPTPVPLPPGSADRWKEYLAAQQRTAPRAILIKLPPPRAELVRLPGGPPLIEGYQYLATMPYGLEVSATYRGWLATQDDLPSHRNAIGDMYLVKGVPFVWVFAPGAQQADWIDP
jgi:hypothetical protein